MLGEVIANRYELVEVVGSGGMSSVYKAHDGLLERNVALKILHPHYGDDDEYVERFRREARMVAQMSHPNIVTVIDRGEDEGRQYIVFELVDGENLKQLVDRTGPLPVRRVVELLSGEVPGVLAFAAPVAYAIVVLFLEPFFVAAGFAMYLNRRADLEAWDIEQEFRRAFAS